MVEMAANPIPQWASDTRRRAILRSDRVKTRVDWPALNLRDT
jgi:hypothetical protein